jgi:hypothetical protein
MSAASAVAGMIGWVRFLPARNSASTVSQTGACACTKLQIEGIGHITHGCTAHRLEQALCLLSYAGADLAR